MQILLSVNKLLLKNHRIFNYYFPIYTYDDGEQKNGVETFSEFRVV